MANGMSKAIEDLQPGNVVLAVSDRNAEGPAEPKEVVAVYHNAPRELLTLRIANSGQWSVASGQNNLIPNHQSPIAMFEGQGEGDSGAPARGRKSFLLTNCGRVGVPRVLSR
jgi:hypothetical protein